MAVKKITDRYPNTGCRELPTEGYLFYSRPVRYELAPKETNGRNTDVLGDAALLNNYHSSP
jgi:hypothetical protein